MGIVERFLQLDLPLDRCVVIGGGILDALGLRPAGDIDVVVERELFATLRKRGDWQVDEKHGDIVLTRRDAEVWRDWGDAPEYSFESLHAGGVRIDGVRFAHPETVVRWKLQHNRPKDAADIKLLQEYLQK